MLYEVIQEIKIFILIVNVIININNNNLASTNYFVANITNFTQLQYIFLNSINP